MSLYQCNAMDEMEQADAGSSAAKDNLKAFTS